VQNLRQRDHDANRKVNCCFDRTGLVKCEVKQLSYLGIQGRISLVVTMEFPAGFLLRILSSSSAAAVGGFAGPET
jgi:hypothetical protein